MTCKTWIVGVENKEIAVQIVCTKKTFKRAVVRNLVKRRFIGAFFDNKQIKMTRIKAKNRYLLYKIYPNKELLKMNFEGLKNELQKLLG